MIEHVLPQAPQFWLSEVVSTQIPLQYVSPAGQTDVQTPLLQLVPVAHVLPHAPQFLLSETVLTQVPLQDVCPAGHVQTPLEHVAVLEQIMPHVPQFKLSVKRLVHFLLQAVWLPGQLYWHCPLTHEEVPPVGWPDVHE
jgi:hypothetical protein